MADMSLEEWESLCDGCGQCCRLLLEDEEAEEDDPVFYETSLCCRLFDPATRRCTRYEMRHKLVPDCVQVTPRNAGQLNWMPNSCAYRRLAEGRGLADWHPLISGRDDSVAEAGVAVPREMVSETRVRLRDLWRFVSGRRHG